MKHIVADQNKHVIQNCLIQCRGLAVTCINTLGSLNHNNQQLSSSNYPICNIYPKCNSNETLKIAMWVFIQCGYLYKSYIITLASHASLCICRYCSDLIKNQHMQVIIPQSNELVEYHIETLSPSRVDHSISQPHKSDGRKLLL
jgi:hypothetical protein